MLYHYTSLNGLLGILRSRSIWATHASYLNDASEFFHGLAFAKQQAGAIFEEDDYVAAFGWAVRHALEGIDVGDLYIASFSQKADLLSQWRGYCPAGGGVCLGFDVKTVRAFCAASGFRLEPCRYEHDDQRRQVFELVEQCYSRFPQPKMTRADYGQLETSAKVDADIEYRERASAGPGKRQADAATAWLCTALSELAPLFKNQGFHEEAEWRIVANQPSKAIHFRPTASYLAPYVELNILGGEMAGALREIIVGPNPNQERCEASVQMLLASSEISGVEVKTSPLPFNVW